MTEEFKETKYQYQKQLNKNNQKNTEAQFELSSDSDTENEIQAIQSAEIFLQKNKQDKKVKVVFEQSPLIQDLEIYDVSLYKGGPLEDKLYSSKKYYRINIRRGNSVGRYNLNEFFFIRRGMQKFYDLQQEYLDENSQISKYHQRVKRVIFSEPFKFLDQNQNQLNQNSITIYKLFKENGEHCQISFIKKFGTWVISSKNVTILAKNEDDLEKYEKERFYWGKMISKQWFKILKSMDKKQIQEIQDIMESKVFIGEYCGFSEKQHITTYDKIQIIFYAITDKQQIDNICLPVDEAFEIFDQFQLQKVKMEKWEHIRNKTQLIEQISSIYSETAIQDMEKEGEGGVLYIVGEQQQQQEQLEKLEKQQQQSSENKNQIFKKTLSLCKLKTTEYNIYRRLREMLKINFQKKISNKIQKFIQEIQKESQFHPPPLPLQYYIELAKFAFEKLEIQDIQWETLRYQFPTFINQIKQENNEILEKIANQQVQQQTQNNQEQSEKNSKKLENQLKNNYLLITPPAFLTDGQIDQLINILNIENIKTVYREEELLKNQVQNQNQGLNMGNILYITHMIPKMTEISYKKIQNFVLMLVGFTESNKEICLKQITEQKELIQKQKYAGNNQTVFQYLQSKNPQVSLDLFFNKINNIQNQLNQNEIKYYEIPHFDIQYFIKNFNLNLENLNDNNENQQNEVLLKNNKQTNQGLQIENQINFEQKQQKQLNLLVLTVFSIPGAGKSYLGQQIKKNIELKKKGYFTHYLELSIDMLRKKLIQKLKQQKPELSKEELFSETGEYIGQEFYNNLENIIKNISKAISQNKNKKIVLFLDRNNVPKKAFQPLESIYKILEENQINNLDQKNMKIAALIPKLTKNEIPVQLQKQIYPFSFNFLIHSIERLLNKRKDHQTMQNDTDDLLKIKICLNFFQDFKNYKFQKLVLGDEKQGFIKYDTLKEFQLTQKITDQNESEIEKEQNLLQKYIGTCIKGVQKINGVYKYDDNKIYAFLKEFYHQKFFIQEMPEKDYQSEVTELLQSFQYEFLEQ